MFPRVFLRNINCVSVLFIVLLATARGNKSLPDRLSSQARSSYQSASRVPWPLSRKSQYWGAVCRVWRIRNAMIPSPSMNQDQVPYRRQALGVQGYAL